MPGKRGNGEGAIYQDAAGRWRAAVNLGWRDGKRRRKYLSGRTRAEVARQLRAVLQSRDAGVDLAAEERAPNLATWLDYWLDNIAVRRVRPSTLDTYRGYVRNRISPNLGHHRLDRLRPEHIEKFYARLGG